MTFNRRIFLGLLAGSAAASVFGANSGHAAIAQPYKAVAFDGFTIFDPRPLLKLAESLFPGKGTDLSNTWRTRQFEYQWLRALGGRYTDFWQITEDSLVFAAQTLKLDLTADKSDQLMQAYLRLTAWPDAPATLRHLKEAGIRLVFLSNLTRKILETNTRHAGLEGLFEQNLSTDQIRSYKPDPKAYAMGVKALGLKREEIVFAAFGGWDAAGAKWYGYPTFWVNRMGSTEEQLGAAPDAAGPGLNDLAKFVLARST